MFAISALHLYDGFLRIKSFFLSSRRRHTRYLRDWSSDVCSSDLHGWAVVAQRPLQVAQQRGRRLGAGVVLVDEARHGGGEAELELAHVAPERGEEGVRGRRSEERRVGKEGRGGGGLRARGTDDV